MTTSTQQKGKMLTGIVVSDKMKDTAVVKVQRFVKHPKYGKYYKVHKRYKAHDPENQHPIGTTVTIRETRPISKHKRFRIVEATETH